MNYPCLIDPNSWEMRFHQLQFAYSQLNITYSQLYRCYMQLLATSHRANDANENVDLSQETRIMPTIESALGPSNFVQPEDSTAYSQLKKEYRTALDEISALMEKIDELNDQAGQQDLSPTNAVVPNSIVFRDGLSFEKKILSLGMYGKIRDAPQEFHHISYTYDGEDMQIDREEFLAQFPPMIIEEVRSKAVSRMAKIEKSHSPSIVGKVVSVRLPENQQARGSRGKNQVDFGFVRIDCTTKAKDFPTLEHGFFKELLCVVLPSTDKKKMHIVFAIGTKEHDSESDSRSVVKYSMQMLAHDYNLLINHARNVMRKNPSADLSEPLRHISWYHITGLIPSERMYEATIPNAPFPFADQILLQQQVEWPDPKGMLVLNGLNPTQARVVQSMARTTDSGLFRLTGPPGTGKTTTIVQFELARMCRFPHEKILSTAPSNKAIQVLLRKLVEKNTADYAIAVIGTNKNIPAAHEDLYAAEFTKPMTKRLLTLLNNNERGYNRKKEFRSAVKQFAERLEFLTDSSRPGLPVEPPVKEAVMNTMQKFVDYDFSSISDKESLDERIHECIEDVRGAVDDIERFILQRAQVVFSTLVASGRKNFHKIVPRFDTVIVDEASQALVPATFIPFKFHPKRCLLVGDPQQLPATVQAHHLTHKGFADSLMLAMQRAMGDSSCAEMLTTQYRMNPAICKAISDLFYGGKLVTDASVLTRQCLRQKHLPATMLLHNAPCAFIDLESIESKVPGGSSANYDEAKLVVKVVQYLLRHDVNPRQIGIVSGYADQVTLLKDLLQKENQRKVHADFAHLAVSTVDGFQGDEKDFMLFSCVRTGTSVGFLNDQRRVNVAMSRGRHANWVFGQARTLRESNSTIRDFLHWVDDDNRNCAAQIARVICGETLLQSMNATAQPAAPQQGLWGRGVSVSTARGAPATQSVAAANPARPQRGPPALQHVTASLVSVAPPTSRHAL